MFEQHSEYQKQRIVCGFKIIILLLGHNQEVFLKYSKTFDIAYSYKFFSASYLGKDMTVDSTYDFEKKRTEPIKYNRNLMVKVV